jgi:hypothetical protein
MAEAYFGSVPASIQTEVLRRLDARLRKEAVAFCRKYDVPLADVTEV